MSIKYKIEIHLHPNIDNLSIPTFFWTLFSYTGNNWCNSGSGWAPSPEDAWQDAYNFYLLHFK